MHWNRLSVRLIPLFAALAIMLAPLAQTAAARLSAAAQADYARARLEKPTNSLKVEGKPSRIIIPAEAIDLKVVEGNYESTGKWTVSTDYANYASSTPLLNNQSGQTLIYGHNNRKIFGPLLSLEPGSRVYVHTDNGRIFEYQYASSESVSPQRGDIIAQMGAGPPGLKIITCKGENFEYRQVMSFKLLRAS